MKQNKEIPAGYKDSPLGIIPESWKIKKLGEIGKIYSGGTPDTDNPLYWNGEINWCTPTDITALNGNKYIGNTITKITTEGLNNSSAKLLPPNSIIVCTRASIGKTVISKFNIATNQGFKNIVPNENIDTHYLYYVVSNSETKLLKLGSGSTFLEVSKSDFENLKFAFPPIVEQVKIAQILSLWDNAIEKQKKLVEKLERKKRGLMQQLLTARIRICGFSGSWQTVKMGDVFKRITRKNTELNDNVVTISAQRGFIKQTDFFNKTIASEIIDNYFLVKKGEFCYNKSYSKGYPMGVVKLLSDFDKAVVTTLYICFALKTSDNSVDFFKYYFDSGSTSDALTFASEFVTN